jgi:hypothetical protein
MFDRFTPRPVGRDGFPAGVFSQDDVPRSHADGGAMVHNFDLARGLD